MFFTGNRDPSAETGNANTRNPNSSAVVVGDYPDEGNIYKYLLYFVAVKMRY